MARTAARIPARTAAGIRAIVALLPGLLALAAAAPSAAQTAAAARATPATPAPATTPPLDSIARAFRARHDVPGVVLAVATPAGDRVHADGFASLRDSSAVTADTRFEIGSITKVFTSLLLAEMAQRGTVSLTDSIGRFLPGAVPAPEFRGTPIRLWHLATHTSALPRLPSNLRPASFTDPYATYGREELLAFLAAYDLPRRPGERAEYSNVGPGLLGELLALHADTAFGALLHAHVLRPLGLTSTYLALHDTADARMAHGHAGGRVVPYWHFDALAGAGALRSSAPDLLRFLRAQLEPPESPLGAAIRETHEIRHEASDALSLALAWHVNALPDGTPVYWHSGGTGGFRTFVGMVPGADVAVVALTNAALPLDVTNDLGMELVRLALRRE